MSAKALKSVYEDVKRISFGVKLIVFLIFLRMLGWGFSDPFFSIFLKDFSNHYTIIGGFLSFMSVVSLLTVIPLMRLADKVKDATIMSDGEIFYFFTIMAYTAAASFKSIPLLLIAFILNGIAHPFVIVGAEAYIRKHDGHAGTASAFGFYNAFTYLGWILGMVIAAYLIPYYSFNTMFLFVLPSIVISFFVLPRIKERGFGSFLKGLKKYLHKRQDFQDIIDDFKNLDHRMFFFLLLAFFDGVITMFQYVFIPLFALSLDLDLKQVALLVSVMYFPCIFSFFFAEMADRLSKMTVIALGLFIGAISFMLLTFIVHQLLIVVLAVMISLSLAIIRPAYNGMITQLTSRHMLGEISGINNLFVRLGHIVGPVFSGVIADIYGIRTSFFLIAFMTVGLCVATMFLHGYECFPKQAEGVKIKLT
jgi:MFS family permease